MGNDFWNGTAKTQANASSILDALNGLKKTNNFSTVYPNYTSLSDEVKIDQERTAYLNELKNIRKNMTSRNTLIIGVIGEPPYAETMGDRNIPYCQNATQDDHNGCLYDADLNPYVSGFQDKHLDLEYTNFDTEVISNIRTADKNIPLVTVMFSGRPMLADSAMNISSAFLAAWLPGTAGGQAVVDAISGQYVIRPQGKADKTNSLSMDWPTNMVIHILIQDSVKNFPIYYPDGEVPGMMNPKYQVGYGLSTAVTQKKKLRKTKALVID